MTLSRHREKRTGRVLHHPDVRSKIEIEMERDEKKGRKRGEAESGGAYCYQRCCVDTAVVEDRGNWIEETGASLRDANVPYALLLLPRRWNRGRDPWYTSLVHIYTPL